MLCHVLYAGDLWRENPLMTRWDIISLQNMGPPGSESARLLPQGVTWHSGVEREFIS